MLEAEFKKQFRQRLENRMRPYNIPMRIIKTKPHNRSFPDWIILCGSKWAGLEHKKDRGSSRQPNQPYYIAIFDEMSYARFVHPDNAEEVIDELERLFTS